MSTALKKTPLARVKDEFGGKDKLVDKIVGVLDAGDSGKDELRKRLLSVDNTKLIRLFSVATKTKQAGGHDKLAVTTAERLGRAKDKDYVTKLGELSNGKLIDILGAAERRSAAAAAPAKATRAMRPEKAAKPATNAAAKPGTAKPATKTTAKRA